MLHLLGSHGTPCFLCCFVSHVSILHFEWNVELFKLICSRLTFEALELVGALFVDEDDGFAFGDLILFVENLT